MSKVEELLEQRLRGVAEGVPVSGGDPDAIVARGRRRKVMTSVVAAAGSALGVLLLVGGTSALLSIGTVTPPADDAPPMVDPTRPTVTTTTATPTTSTTMVAGPAPWSGTPVAESVVPHVLVHEWSAASNQLWCAALVPADLAANTVAIPRAANFGGGWAVAWDAPSGPGVEASGAPCADCGRSAFGIAGIGTTPDADTGVRQPTVLRYTDGSVAGYGGAGFDDAATQRLAEIVIPGQGCVYQAWSHLGDAHLESLIESLRFVEGLAVGPVTLYETLPVEVAAGGEAPWAGPPLDAAQVPDVLSEQWAGTSARVYFADVGGEVSDAAVRAAALGVWGVAWDLPSGPGHDRNNMACSVCGRGVIGLGLVAEWSPELAVPELPVEITWDDGSVARYGVRTGQGRIPMALQRIADVDGGGPIHPGYEAIVHIEGVGELVVWSHISEDHLRYLLSQLRITE